MITTLESQNTICAGSCVLIWFEDEVDYLVQIEPGRKFAIHTGKPILMDDLIGKSFGSWIECGHSRALLLEPTVDDLMMKVRRESGVIYPKDAALILMKLGIRSGSRVIEIGTGSGSLTMALASQVAPSGKVYTYDRRGDFQKIAESNLRRADLLPYVDFFLRAENEAFQQTGVDAVISDVPEPWREVDAIKTGLKDGGRIATLNPTYNQIEQAGEAFQAAGFVMVEALEILVRGILARRGRTRPEQRMIGHTEFILFAVKPDLSIAASKIDSNKGGSEE